MAPSPRTPQQRDRRFARVRRLSRTLLVGSTVVSGAMVAYLDVNTKPEIEVRVTPTTTSPTTSATSTTTTTTTAGTTSQRSDSTRSASSRRASTPSTATTTTVPTTVPVTTTTTCYSSPSGHVTCS